MGLGFRVLGLGLGVWGLEFGVWGLGFGAFALQRVAELCASHGLLVLQLRHGHARAERSRRLQLLYLLGMVRPLSGGSNIAQLHRVRLSSSSRRWFRVWGLGFGDVEWWSQDKDIKCQCRPHIKSKGFRGVGLGFRVPRP